MHLYSGIALSVTLSFFCGGGAGIWPFDTFASADVQAADQNVKQVAIIGAGAAGSSTAYYLHKFAEEVGVDINITVFEKASYVGGRSTTVNAFDDPLEPVELGASIFVEVNKILKNAADEFGLHRQAHMSATDQSEMLGIWNGEKFVYTQRGDASWFDLAKMFWKYGLAPIRTQRLMRSTIEKFLKLYEPPFFPFKSLSDSALDLELTWITAVTGEQYLAANGIGPPFTTDIIQASTRVNYGQNLGIIHGLEVMVCMAIEGAMSIRGGNWQIFHNMLKSSGANVLLNTTVSGLGKKGGKYNVQFSPSNLLHTGATIERAFDTVVLAAPHQFSAIEMEKDLLERVPDEIPYVALHVTLFTSPLRLSGAYFGIKDGAQVPSTILTTLSPMEDPADREKIVGKCGFFSISTLRTITNPETFGEEYLYKVFSPEKVTEDFLSDIFGMQRAPGITVNSSTSWYYPYIWNSYPYGYPRVTFEEIELARGLYYTSGIESFISTMETSALMGMNVARLIVEDYLEMLGKFNVPDTTSHEVQPKLSEEL